MKNYKQIDFKIREENSQNDIITNSLTHGDNVILVLYTVGVPTNRL